MFTLEGVRYAALIAVLTVLAAGSAFAAIEHSSEGEGIWWAITTMTTTGYGDVTPTTPAGRVLASIVMLVGLGFGTLLVGAVAEQFIARDVTPEVEEVEMTEAEMLAELRSLTLRLERIEAALQRRRA